MCRARGAVGRVGRAWARVTLGKGPGATACHVSVEGESPGRALPVFRELVGSEAV